MQLDLQRGRKLELRWDGLYLLKRLTRNGRSAFIADFHSKEEIGLYHMDTIKQFIPRSAHTREGEGWEQLRKIQQHKQT